MRDSKVFLVTVQSLPLPATANTMRTLLVSLLLTSCLAQVTRLSSSRNDRTPLLQDNFRGRRRKVVRKRPTSVRQLSSLPSPAPPVQTEAPRPLPPAPPKGQAPPTGQLITDTACPEPEGLQLYPKEDNCNQFYKCANGTLTLETCGNGLLYDESKGLAGSTHNHCSYNWEADCGNRPADNTPISTPGCQYQFGIFPSGEGCFA